MNSIDEGRFIDVNGIEQWITLRGRDRDNPILLILSGAGAAFSPMAPYFAPWEADFTLVQWDQPGAGATHARNRDAAVPLSIGRIVTDGIAVAETVTRYLGRPKLAVLGFSGGTIVGLGMIRQRPDLFSAFAGSGQVVDWPRQDAASYALLVERARRTGDAAMLAELEGIGPPPYADTATDAIKSKHAGAMTDAEQAAMAAIDPAVQALLQSPPADASYMAPGVTLDEPYARAMAAYDELRGEIVTFDARRGGTEFRVPVFFFQGDEDVFTVSAEVERFAEEIHAPRKAYVPMPGVGHSTYLMRDALLELLVEHVRGLE